MSPNARNALIAAVLLALALLVWPTPFAYWHERGAEYRRNRITGGIQMWDSSTGTWHR